MDARSDVFSLGAVVYEAATGQQAFGGPTAAVVFDAILNRGVRPIRELVADAPPDFVALVERMLAKEARDRHARAGEVAAALREIRRMRDSGAQSGATSARVPSVAVLPFADMSPKKDQDWFCEGIAEELIGALAKLPHLRVASRTSSFRFRSAEDIRRIGEQLGVGFVLEGGVRTAGTRLRVTAQLTNVADGYLALAELGRLAEAVAALERAVDLSGRLPYPLGWLGYALGRADRREDAERVLAELVDACRRGVGRPVSVASVYAGLRDRDQAFAWLERAIDEHDPYLPFTLHFPIVDDLRDDSRFALIKRRVYGACSGGLAFADPNAAVAPAM